MAFYSQHQETILNYIGRIGINLFLLYLYFFTIPIGISFPQIVGIDWRIDYSIRSKATGKDNVPMFYISLKVLENNGQLNNVYFLANLEEMHDLLARVRDAVKQVERILNTSD